MEFRDAVRHLESLGLTVENVAQERRRKARRMRTPPIARNPTVRRVPVQIVREGKMPKKLAEMIRQSRAEIRISFR